MQQDEFQKSQPLTGIHSVLVTFSEVCSSVQEDILQCQNRQSIWGDSAQGAFFREQSQILAYSPCTGLCSIALQEATSYEVGRLPVGRNHRSD